jgi:hypothetical protein
MQIIWKLEYEKDGQVNVYEGFNLKDPGHYVRMNVVSKDGIPSHTLPRNRTFSRSNIKSLTIVKD